MTALSWFVLETLSPKEVASTQGEREGQKIKLPCTALNVTVKMGATTAFNRGDVAEGVHQRAQVENL